MKVALMANEGGGIYSVAYGLAKALSNLDVQTTIFLTSSKSKSNCETVNKNFKIVNLPIVNSPPRSLWFIAGYFRVIPNMFREYDVIHAVSPEIGMGYTFSKPKIDKPMITTLHGSNRAYLKAFMELSVKYWTRSDFAYHVLELPLHEITTKRCVEKSKRVVVPSFATLNELKTCEHIDISKISVIANGLNFDEICNKGPLIASKETTENTELSMLYAGRLFWMKGIKYVLETYSRLRSQFKNLRLRIYGEGPLEKEIRKFIKDRGLGSTVFFGGFLPHNRLIHEIRKADMVLFPSLYESQPVFALEAMACRKPLVAFDLVSTREIIKKSDAGLLAKKGDIDDLCDKTSQVLNDQELRRRLGQNGYKYVRRNHDWNEQAKKYLQVYEDLIADVRN